jgi:hypothetical protein
MQKKPYNTITKEEAATIDNKIKNNMLNYLKKCYEKDLQNTTEEEKDKLKNCFNKLCHIFN